MAASHIDRLTCKPLHSCGGNQCSPPLRLKALFETTANGWSNSKRTQRQCHEQTDWQKVHLQTANSTVTLLDEQRGLCWDSHENQSGPDNCTSSAFKKIDVEHDTDH